MIIMMMIRMMMILVMMMMIQAKLDALDEEAEKIKATHPAEAVVIQQRSSRLREVWDQLTEMLKERDAKLEEAGDLHRFLKDLDHFQV